MDWMKDYGGRLLIDETTDEPPDVLDRECIDWLKE